jgi:hypothetical protein
MGDRVKQEHVSRQLAEVLRQIDSGHLFAKAAQRAFIAGALGAITPQPGSPRDR